MKRVWDINPKTNVSPKKHGFYPWPCKSEPEKTIELFPDDVLTKSKDGTYMKHTGIGCFNIRILDSDVQPAKPGSLWMV